MTWDGGPLEQIGYSETSEQPDTVDFALKTENSGRHFKEGTDGCSKQYPPFDHAITMAVQAFYMSKYVSTRLTILLTTKHFHAGFQSQQSRHDAEHDFGGCEALRRSDLFLQDKEIHVWVVGWRQIIPWIYSNWQVLTAEEKNHIERFSLYEDRMRGATGKILTRILLARYVNMSINDICININDYGKPYFGNIFPLKNVQYSISHSGEIVLLVFGKFPKIGADVEQIREFPDYLEIARNFFTSEESRKIRESRSIRTFFQYWTAKEAYVKALGEGLHKDLKSFEINRNCVWKQGRILTDWRIIPIKISREYSANVAVQIKE